MKCTQGQPEKNTRSRMESCGAEDIRYDIIWLRRRSRKKGGREGEIFDVTWRAWNLEMLPADFSAASPTAEPRMVQLDGRVLGS